MLNLGINTLVTVAGEATFRGGASGAIYALTGQLGGNFAPVLESGQPRIGFYRQQDGDSFSARYYTGTMQMEYHQTDLMKKLFGSWIPPVGTTHQLVAESLRNSLSIGFAFKPSGPYHVIRGAIVKAIQLQVRSREIPIIRIDFLGAQLVSGTEQVATVPASANLGLPLNAVMEYRGVATTRVPEVTMTLQRELKFGNYGRDKLATEYVDQGTIGMVLEMAEYLDEDATAADVIAADVRNQTEVAQKLTVNFPAAKKLELTLPRSIIRSGTPPALMQGGILYRTTSEVQFGDALDSGPALVLTT